MEYLLVIILLFLCTIPGFCSSVGDSGFHFETESGNMKFYSNNKQLNDTSGSFWSVETDSGIISSTDSRNVTAKSTQNGSLIISGNAGDIDWTAKCESLFASSITVTVKLKPARPMELRRVMLFNCKSPLDSIVAKTGLQDIALFYRDRDNGMFASLDFPYSKIFEKDGVKSISYPPHIKLKANQEYTCHSFTIGATRPSGKIRYGFYEGEVDAIDSYIQSRFKPRFERPIFMSASIVNRYTQLEGNWIFYTMKDHPTLTFNRDILKRELTLMKQLGIEFYQVFPGVFDWGPNDPSDKSVHQAMDWAHKNNVRMGDYSGSNCVFCPHYNQYANTLQGTGIEPCFGSRKFVDWYSNRVANTAKKFGFEVHVMDFLSLGICNNPNHGHPIGEDSLYHQIKGLTDVMDRIASVSPDMLIWPNSGCWTDLLPKIAWHAPSQYLTDPFISTPWQGLNQTRLLDDARREQMVNLHYSHFIPYRYFTNCQYFFSQNSIVPDIRNNYEYGALSTLAVTPNICPAEIRPWIDDLSVRDRDKVVAFYKKWTSFIKANFDLWKHTYHTANDPTPGSVEIYSHADGKHGFVFIVNSGYASRTVDIALDSSLGFRENTEYEITEIYPWERLLLTPQGPFAGIGTKIPFQSPAQSVTILEINPKPLSIESPRLYGIPGDVKQTAKGYTLTTSGPQGTTNRFALLLPKNSSPVTSVDICKQLPDIDRRQWDWDPTDIKLLATGKPGVMADLTFRRKAASKDISKWKVIAGTMEDGTELNWPAKLPIGEDITLPAAAAEYSGKLSNFLGAYLENGFSEDQKTIIYLNTSGTADKTVQEIESVNSLASAFLSNEEMADMPILQSNNTNFWLQAEFNTPVAYMGGCEPKFEDHTLIVLPFKDQNKIKYINAWINGYPVDVQTYRYPRNRGLMCRWLDTTGSAMHPGTNNIVLYIEFMPD